MQRAKAFFYVCVGLFLLALSYHLGAQGAQAQGTSATGVSMCTDLNSNGQMFVVNSNGDLYTSFPGARNSWQFVTNVFTGGAVNVQQHTLGQLKARFRDPAPAGR